MCTQNEEKYAWNKEKNLSRQVLYKKIMEVLELKIQYLKLKIY